jgi:hypothetical protein
MSHVGLSLIVMPVSLLNFQLLMLKDVSLSHMRLHLAVSIVVADTAFASSCQQMCDVKHVNCHFAAFVLTLQCLTKTDLLLPSQTISGPKKFISCKIDFLLARRISDLHSRPDTLLPTSSSTSHALQQWHCTS